MPLYENTIHAEPLGAALRQEPSGALIDRKWIAGPLLALAVCLAMFLFAGPASAATASLKQPLITSFSPAAACPGDIVTLKAATGDTGFSGQYFDAVFDMNISPELHVGVSNTTIGVNGVDTTHVTVPTSLWFYPSATEETLGRTPFLFVHRWDPNVPQGNGNWVVITIRPRAECLKRQITLTPTYGLSRIGTTQTVTAHVSDVLGKVAGDPITFSLTGVPVAVSSLTPTSTTSNYNGDALLTFTNFPWATGTTTITVTDGDVVATAKSGNIVATANRVWTDPCLSKVAIWTGAQLTATYDGTRCQVLKIATGATAFIYEKNYYVIGTPLPCPAGPFDGTGCFVTIKPATGFIYNNAFYVDAGVGNSCPVGSWFDGAHCYIAAAPSGTLAFDSAGKWYTTRPGTCLQGKWDGANCYVGTVPVQRVGSILGGYFYYDAV